MAPDPVRKFGTFQAVFIPTLLTILGVIMYLRLPWVVGSVGLLGAILIIGLGYVITITTALSMSSITTNIRVGAGGAFSIISQSLGLEVGGSIGISFYLSQALAVALYVFGFREGLHFLFPAANALALDAIAFGVIFLIVLRSANLAFRVQYVILAVVAASLGAVFGTIWFGSWTAPAPTFSLGDGESFWLVFAIFFPAVTGIMAGANMSGELKDPRRSVPLGTLGAIAVSLVIYVALAFWAAGAATSADLQGNFTIMIDTSLWPPLVIAGLLAATFSSALNSLVGASRILQALGEHGVVPRSTWFARRSPSGEPHNAIIFTGAVAAAGLLLRDLNAIAPLITMFFLITYATINVVILLEQSLGLVSFRPLMRIPRAVPVVGTVWCLFAMFIINPTFSLVALFLILLSYYVLMHRHLRSPYGDVRSGLFVAIAEWAAKKAKSLPYPYEHAWKANLLVPVERTPELRGVFGFLRDITHPRGSLNLLALTTSDERDGLADRVASLAQAFREEGVFATWTVKEAESFGGGVVSSLQTLRSAFFRPNIVFLTAPQEAQVHAEHERVFAKAKENQMGILVFATHPRAGLGRRQAVNVWIPPRSPDWTHEGGDVDFDLSILVAYKLLTNWEGRLRLLTTVADPAEGARAKAYLEELRVKGRLPRTEVVVGSGPLEAFLPLAPQGDLNVFVLEGDLDPRQIGRRVEATRSACLFASDSGQESGLV